jgi:hypothetical protein
MKKNIIKFIIIFSLIFGISNSKISAQNLDGLGKLIKILEQAPDKISGEKLEKLLIENHILVYETVRYEKQSSYQYHAEWSFNKDKTYTVIDKNNYRYNNSSIKHPDKGRWELAGLGSSIVRLDDASNGRFQISFSENGNIYGGSEKYYSYSLENIQEKISREARLVEEKRIAEELRLKKIEEEKRQLAIKREQERIKQEQERIKQEEEKKRFQAEYELAVKKDKERREEEERKELYASIVKYSLLGLFLLIISYLTYKYKSKIFEYKSKIFLDLKKSFKPVKENLLKTIKDISEKKKTSKKNINPIIEKPIRIKDGITDPMHCQVCEKKTKHYVSLPFPVIVSLAMCFFVVGFILIILAKCRLTCSKCGNSYISWSL